MKLICSASQGMLNSNGNEGNGNPIFDVPNRANFQLNGASQGFKFFESLLLHPLAEEFFDPLQFSDQNPLKSKRITAEFVKGVKMKNSKM